MGMGAPLFISITSLSAACGDYNEARIHAYEIAISDLKEGNNDYKGL